MNKIYFLGDYYRGDQDQNIKALYSLVSPIFYDTGIECKAIYFQQKYSDQEFYVKTLQGFGESIFKTFNLDQSTAVIGFELNPVDIEFLKKHNIKWLNFEIHPIRFLKDLCFNISASFELDLELLKISPQEIKMVASTTKAKLELKNLDLSFNSLLILGQTPIDKSIFFDGKFKNLLDYLHDLHILSKNFDHVYYRPHPYLTDPKVDKILQEELKVEILDNQYNFYHLMSLEQIKGVCGISSSSLYEAKFFDKEVVFLEPRVRSFSVPVFLNDFLNGCNFWLQKLLGFDLILTEFKFDLIDNTCRDLYCYWSYKTPFQDLSNSIYNLSLKTLETEQYAHDVEKRAIEAESRAIQAEQKALESQVIYIEQRTIAAETRAQEANERVGHLQQEVNAAQAQAQNAEQQYNMIINSRSWKFTQPLRLIKYFFLNRQNIQKESLKMVDNNLQIISVEKVIQRVKEEISNRNKRNDSEIYISKPILQLSLSNPLPFQSKTHYLIADFSQYYDKEFIINCYRGLLRRDPDEQGMNYYLLKLRSGEYSKSEIIAFIRYSKEGKKQNIHVAGTKKRFLIALLFRAPLVGCFFKSVFIVFTLPRLLQRINQNENYFAQQQEIANHNFRRIQNILENSKKF